MRSSARICLSVALALAGFLASACSTKARRVDCEWRLEPINRPAPKGSVEPGTTRSETEGAER
jgi:hypothetical protein